MCLIKDVLSLKMFESTLGYPDSSDGQRGLLSILGGTHLHTFGDRRDLIVIHALIISSLDDCNAFHVRLFSKSVWKLQLAQRAETSIRCTNVMEHITRVFYQLHCLSVSF